MIATYRSIKDAIERLVRVEKQVGIDSESRWHGESVWRLTTMDGARVHAQPDATCELPQRFLVAYTISNEWGDVDTRSGLLDVSSDEGRVIARTVRVSEEWLWHEQRRRIGKAAADSAP